MLKPLLASAFLGAALAAQAQAVKLQHIALDLQLDWKKQEAFGTAALTLSPQTPLQTLRLDAAHLHVERISQSGKALQFTQDSAAADGALKVQLARMHTQGETITLRITYRTQWINHSDPGNIWSSTGLGLRWFEPTLTDPRKRRVVWASGDPRSARHWMPTLDDPSQWHTSELRATVDAPLQVFASGELQSVKTTKGKATYHYKSSVPHRPQQMQFIVGDYRDLPSPHARLRLHNHGYPHEMDGVTASVPRLPDTIDFFTELLGTPMAQRSYRQVFVPDFPWTQSGMGLSMQSENMVDDAGTHADYLYLWNVCQAEAAAAQWIGVKAGAGDWREHWIDKAFPRHLGGLYSASRNTLPEYLLFTHQADVDAALAEAAKPDAKPLVLKPLVRTDRPSTEELNAATAARGSVVLHMLRHELGDVAWQRVLKRVAAMSGAISSADLETAASAEAGKPMDWFFKQWMHRADHPVFVISHGYDAAKKQLSVSVKQTQAGAPFAGHITLELGATTRRVWLAARVENQFTIDLPEPPPWVHADANGTWLAQRKDEIATSELLRQFLGTGNTLSRHWAQVQLVQRARAADASQADLIAIQAAFRTVATRTSLQWRERFNALGAWRGLAAPASRTEAVALDEATVSTLLGLIQHERSWLRAGALGFLGMSRDPKHAPLYLGLVSDPSDRVILNAAVALGKTGDARAFDALKALPAHPSWKNQSWVAALNGLRELRDPRGIPLALAALQDAKADRWTLATPVWDHRLAAADTLRALGAGAQGMPLLQNHLADSLKQGQVNDSFYNVQLMVALAQPEAKAALDALQTRFADLPGAKAAVEALKQGLEAHLTLKTP